MAESQVLHTRGGALDCPQMPTANIRTRRLTTPAAAGITCDLRHNCSDSIDLSTAQQEQGGQASDPIYLGNASCALQVRCGGCMIMAGQDGLA